MTDNPMARSWEETTVRGPWTTNSHCPVSQNHRLLYVGTRKLIEAASFTSPLALP
jgi:hypothetical protein